MKRNNQNPASAYWLYPDGTSEWGLNLVRNGSGAVRITRRLHNIAVSGGGGADVH